MRDGTASAAAAQPEAKSTAVVIGASSIGSMFEFYDFFLFGLLAANISTHFFSGVNETTGFILALAVFAAGFAVRPFGALVFGRIGDLAGRKNTFLVTMVIMGLSTFLIGVIPSYSSIGLAAPITLVGLRILQGLALGGEYGGAATYVAEHAPTGRRGFYTSFIQATASLGLLLALAVVISVRLITGPETFAAWGWRIPFLASALLLGVSLWIRLQLEESPVFAQMKAEGTTSKAPLRESFANWANLRVVLIALFGVAVGVGVVTYTGQLYTMFFLVRTLGVDDLTANTLNAVAFLLAAPLSILFGHLSDKIGRKPVLIGALVLAAVTYMPLFHWLTFAANPTLYQVQQTSPVTVAADPRRCSFQFDPIGKQKFDTTACDIAKTFLTKRGVSYINEATPMSGSTDVRIGATVVHVSDPTTTMEPARAAVIHSSQSQMGVALKDAGYPERADPAQVNKSLVAFILFIIVGYVAMVYAPVAAILVELFPARIRYTSMSLPYHIGIGWFGGFLPTTAFAMVAGSGNVYEGIWYPIVGASISAVVALLWLPETFRRDI